jgi:hypothetical protein
MGILFTDWPLREKMERNRLAEMELKGTVA